MKLSRSTFLHATGWLVGLGACLAAATLVRTTWQSHEEALAAEEHFRAVLSESRTGVSSEDAAMAIAHLVVASERIAEVPDAEFAVAVQRFEKFAGRDRCMVEKFSLGLVVQAAADGVLTAGKRAPSMTAVATILGTSEDPSNIAVAIGCAQDLNIEHDRGIKESVAAAKRRWPSEVFLHGVAAEVYDGVPLASRGM